jgi:hypothetical protein
VREFQHWSRICNNITTNVLHEEHCSCHSKVNGTKGGINIVRHFVAIFSSRKSIARTLFLNAFNSLYMACHPW